MHGEGQPTVHGGGVDKQSPYFQTFMEPRNRYQGMNSASLCSLAGRYDNPFPPRFLASIDSLNIPEPVFLNVYGAQESIPRNEFRQPI
jgi:hypothetical protein